jgi:hypothetical protein
MIGYRFLSPAEEEMVEASLFYDSAASGLGNDFLDYVQRWIARLGLPRLFVKLSHNQ